MADWQPPGDEVPIYPSTPADNPYLQAGPYGQPGGQPPYGYPYPPPPGYPYGYRPIPVSEQRPGTLTAAAVLGYVTAGLLILAGIILFSGASLVNDIDNQLGTNHDSLTAEFTFDGFLNLLAGGLLIAGGVVMTGRRDNGRIVYTVGAAIVLVEAIYWLARWSSKLDNDVGVIVYGLLFAALTIIGLSLAWTRASSSWLRPRT